MNKPKIDLKARLGRRTGGTPASASIPPPTGVNPPHPSVAPMSQGGGYAPVPPPSRASYDPLSSPPMQVPAPMRVAAPAVSTADVEAEFAEVRRGGRKKVIMVAGAAAFVGCVLGFAVGGLNERNNVAEAAVVGAKTLTTEIDAANAAVTKLSEILNSASKALKDGNFPENEVRELGGLNIPFDGSNLSGKSIGRFKPQLITMLIDYAGATSRVNEQKDRLRGLLSFSKEGIQELLAQRTNPQVHWGVTLQDTPQGPLGAMQVLPDAFPLNADKGKGGWPSEFNLVDGNQKVAVKRYTGGDPLKGNTPQLIPIIPATQTTVCPTDTIVRLRRELSDMQRVLNGDETPGQEVQGVVALGDSIKKQLSAIGG